MLDKEKHEGFLKQIMERYENPEDAAEMLTAMRDDYDESHVERAENADAGEWKEKYNTLKKTYVERFFGGDAKMAEVKGKQKEDAAKDGTDMSFESLFKSAEGYDGKDES